MNNNHKKIIKNFNQKETSRGSPVEEISKKFTEDHHHDCKDVVGHSMYINKSKERRSAKSSNNRSNI